jgi:hypothetical protein
MACPWQKVSLFLLIIRCAWSIVAPDYLSHWTSFDNHYKRDFSVSTLAKQDDLMIAQEYSWQRLQTNKYGLPRCIQQQNQCQQIGIIGAGEFSFSDRL